MSMKKRSLPLLLSVLMVFVLLLSLSFMVLEANHHCTGDGCAYCLQGALCRNLFKDADFRFSALRSASALLLGLGTLFSVFPLPVYFQTPVEMKVKLSD